MAGNLSNRSSGVQIPRDICTRFGRYLYSTKCSWIIKINILLQKLVIWVVQFDKYATEKGNETRPNTNICDKYILLDVLLCSIAEYFYELCSILASP